MATNKLYALLKTFSKEELKAAKKFIQSPYFNTDKQVLLLYNLVCKAHPGMEGSALENTRLFKSLFPQIKQYDDHKLRSLRSKLIKLLEQYMALEALQKNPQLETRLVVTAYRERGLYSYFKSAIQAGRQALEAGSDRGIEYHAAAVWLLQQLYFHPHTVISRPNNQDISALIGHLEAYFTMLSLCYGSEYAVRQQLLAEGSPSQYEEQVNALAQQDFFKDSPVIQLLYQLISTGTQPGVEFDFETMQNSLLEQQPTMGPFEFSVCMKLLINAGVVRSNRGEPAALQALFENTKFRVENMPEQMKQQNVQAYLNCVISGAHAGEFEWTERFIQDYVPNLNEDVRERAIDLCYAILFYHKARRLKDMDLFSEASKKLSRLSQVDEILGLTIRPLELRILYDSLPPGHPDIQRLFAAAKNANTFFTSHVGLAAQKRKEYKNFVRYLKKLARFKSKKSNSQEALENFGAQLIQEEQLILKHWLLEKLEELKNPSSLDWLKAEVRR